MQISDTLRQAIAGSSLRQFQLATLAGIHPSTLSKALNGVIELRPYDRRVLAIARVLNVKPEDAFERSETEEGKDAP